MTRRTGGAARFSRWAAAWSGGGPPSLACPAGARFARLRLAARPSGLRSLRGALSRALLLACLAPMAAARADDLGHAEAPADGLDGRAIYERVVANRFRSFSQDALLISADRAGRTQQSRFELLWKDFRDAAGQTARGVISKTLVKYTYPFDLRHAGYLVQANEARGSDQFVYYPSRRRVVRVNLRGEAVYGTDFSFEDVVPREAGDFDYRRLRDSVVGGTPVRVVDLFPRQLADSEYSKIRVYVDRDRHVVVRARYWDAAGVEIKELRAPPSRIQEFDGVFVPMEATMRHLRLESQTTLVVNGLVPNPDLDAESFDLSRLETH